MGTARVHTCLPAWVSGGLWCGAGRGERRLRDGPQATTYVNHLHFRSMQCFSAGGHVAPWGQWVTSGDICGWQGQQEGCQPLMG